MVYKEDKIIYNGQLYRVYDLLAKKGFSFDAYRKKRKQGLSIEESFQHCIKVKRKQVCRKDKNVLEIAKTSGFSKKVFYEGFYKNKSVEQIIQEQEQKRNQNEEYLNYLYSIGLPKEYSSLKEFCNQNCLNAGLVHKNIQNGMNLYDAVLYSFEKKQMQITKYVYLGIQLKSLAQKYQLDYIQICFWLRNGKNYQEAIEREVFTRAFYKNMGGRSNYLWNYYQTEFLQDRNNENAITQEESLFLMNYHCRIEKIKKDFLYYAFLNSISITEYQNLNIEDRVRKVLLNYESIPFTLFELYYLLDFENGFMKEFQYLEEKQLWIYRGNREILQRLKKPSN